MGFPGVSVGKEFACVTGDPGLSPGSGRSPGKGNGYLLQCFSLENSIDRGAWWAIVSPWGRKELDMTGDFTFSHRYMVAM